MGSGSRFLGGDFRICIVVFVESDTDLTACSIDIDSRAITTLDAVNTAALRTRNGMCKFVWITFNSQCINQYILLFYPLTIFVVLLFLLLFLFLYSFLVFFSVSSDILTCRQVLNVIVFLGFMVNYMLRVNLTFAVVDMVLRRENNAIKTDMNNSELVTLPDEILELNRTARSLRSFEGIFWI